MIGLIGTLIEYSVAMTSLADAAKPQKVLGSAVSLAVVATVSLKLFPAFSTDRIIGLLSDIHSLSFRKLISTSKVDQNFFIVEPE